MRRRPAIVLGSLFGLLAEPLKLQVADVTDQGARFAASGWHVQSIDGHDPDAIHAALEAAKAGRVRVRVRSHGRTIGRKLRRAERRDRCDRGRDRGDHRLQVRHDRRDDLRLRHVLARQWQVEHLALRQRPLSSRHARCSS